MKLTNNYIFVTFLILKVNSIPFHKRVQDSQSYFAYPCSNNTEITSQFSAGLINGYNLIINKDIKPGTNLKLKFDSEAAVAFDKVFGIFNDTRDFISNTFDITLLKSNNTFLINVKGQPPPFSPPYLISIKINGYEYCHQPNLTYFEDYPVGVLKRPSVPNRFCGRRKILHNELVCNGFQTKPGDWPWHAALYRLQKSGLSYNCDGTLISKFFILTAAQCTTIRGVAILPEKIRVLLGKYYIYGGNVALQEKEVLKVNVHSEFSYRTLNYDISLLKLKTEAVYNNYVQPACLWYDDVYKQFPSSQLTGTVAGWGIDNTDSISRTLYAANMPIVPDLTCALINPFFFVNGLKTTKRFCAGYTDGTSACNRDRGGSFSVFVPDLAKSNNSEGPGAWYVRGIISTNLARSDENICDPNTYAIFTDVGEYLDWIKSYVSNLYKS